MPARKLREFLDQNHIKYVSIQHSPAFTAQEVAESVHLSGREMAKTVIVRVEGEMAMVVLPATRKVVLLELRELLGAERVTLATEEEFKTRFPDCEVGAMPPFGNLYGMKVYAAPSLREEKAIAFNAGTHTEVIRMTYRDFESLVNPVVLSFTT